MQIKKDACKIHSVVFSVDPEICYIDWKHTQLVIAFLRLIPDFAYLSETFLDIEKSKLKTGI